MKLLIWDIPTRLFHWLFAGSVLGAFGIAQFVDKDNNVLFNLHIVFGTFAGILLVWRLIWAIVGSRHAKFKSFIFSRKEILGYFKSVFSGKGQYHAAHNPGSAPVLIGILLLTAVAVTSGYAQSVGGEFFEEVHEIVPKLVLALAVVHIVGVMMASKMHKQFYAWSMIDGRKRAQPGKEIGSSRPFAGLVMLILVFGALYAFASRFNRASGSLQLPGGSAPWVIGEEPEHEETKQNGEGDD